jgi:hypothetical protein
MVILSWHLKHAGIILKKTNWKAQFLINSILKDEIDLIMASESRSHHLIVCFRVTRRLGRLVLNEILE